MITEEYLMLRWFDGDHLDGPPREVAFYFAELARVLCVLIEPGPARTIALRQLQDARDSAVWARGHAGK